MVRFRQHGLNGRPGHPGRYPAQPGDIAEWLQQYRNGAGSFLKGRPPAGSAYRASLLFREMVRKRVP